MLTPPISFLTHLTRGENEKENGDPLTKERALLAYVC